LSLCRAARRLHPTAAREVSIKLGKGIDQLLGET
jgi:hypothetical protein